MLVVYLSILLLYAWPLLKMGFAFVNMPPDVCDENKSTCAVTILICARNEEKKIEACLNSIVNQNYDHSLIEIIFVDDASSDHTVGKAKSILQKSGIKYLIIKNDSKRGKKKSLHDAIPQSANPFVITRDADTVSSSKLWLRTIMGVFEKTQVDFIICPVGLYPENNFFNALQRIENNVLLVLSAGSAQLNHAFLCSGANLAYKKSLFEKINGFESHLNIQSGDDVLFLADIKKKTKAKISFLKSADAIVTTFAEKNLTSLFKQKIRWAAKTAYNPDLYTRYLAAVISTCNLMFMLALVQLIVFNNLQAFVFIIAKCFLDILLLFLGTRFMKDKNLVWYSIPAAFIYPIYSTIITFVSFVYQPRWK